MSTVPLRLPLHHLVPLLLTVMASSTIISSGNNSNSHAAVHALAMSGGGLSSKTVVVGLNAAFQKRFVLPPSTPLTPGSVHRASRVEEGLGGKGQDVAVSLSQLWPAPAVRPLALAQFVGTGPGGDAVMGLLSDTLGSAGGDDNGGSDGSGWDALTVRCRSPMRTCTTIVGTDTSTELVEPSGVVEEEEMEELMSRIGTLSAAGDEQAGAAAFCVMGSMPPGCPDGTYANLCKSIVGDETLTLVDSVIGLEPLLGAMAAKKKQASSTFGGGNVLKVNAAELCRLAGVERAGGGEAEGATSQELTEAVAKFLSAYCSDASIDALDYMAITDGRHPAHLVEVNGGHGEEGSTRLIRMDVVDLTGSGDDDVLYPIGAGDTVAAGTLAAWLNLRRGEEDGGAELSPMPRETHKAMLRWRDGIDGGGDDEEDLRNVLTAFAFGLACGSASCLKQENSVFDVDDALRLFGRMSKPTL